MKSIIRILQILLIVAVFTTLSAEPAGKKPVPNDVKIKGSKDAVDANKNTTTTTEVYKDSNTKVEVKKGTEAKPTIEVKPATEPVSTEPIKREVEEAKPTEPVSAEPVPANKADVTIEYISTMFVNAKAAFEISATDSSTAVDYIEYKVNDEDYKKYSAPIFLPKEGINRITYRSVDVTGNKESAKVLIITVDNTSPFSSVKPVESLYVVDNTQFASDRNTFVINANDAVSGVKKIEYSIDSELKKEYTNQPFKIEKPGNHVIKFTATDFAGNTSPEQTYIINVDTTKPAVEIIESQPLVKINGKNYAKKNTSFSIKASDSESGVNKVLVKVDEKGDFLPYAESILFTEQGEHIIEAKAIDNVGNESDISKFSVLVNVKPPTTIIKAVTGKETKDVKINKDVKDSKDATENKDVKDSKEDTENK